LLEAVRDRLRGLPDARARAEGQLPLVSGAHREHPTHTGGRVMPRIGLQLYTIRDECSRDLEGALRAVAELGYDGVELFDLHGHEPATVRAWLDELGLAVAGRHAGLAALEGELPELAEELGVLGCDRLALSWIDPPESAADGRAACERIEAVA